MGTAVRLDTRNWSAGMMDFTIVLRIPDLQSARKECSKREMPKLRTQICFHNYNNSHIVRNMHR